MAKANDNSALLEQELVLTRVFDAPRSLVFKVWTDPKHLKVWWGPHNFTNPVCKVDVRPGGALHIDMRAPDGTIYPCFGEYRDIVEPKRLVFTSGALGANGEKLFEILNSVSFEEYGGKTKLTMRARPIMVTPIAGQYLSGQEQGWWQSLEKLDQHLRNTLNSAQPAGGVNTADREIVLSRDFSAPRELVFDAWTKPQNIGAWWGPNGFTTTTSQMDFRAGGLWLFTMHGPDGTDFPNEIVYEQILHPKLMVYVHGPTPIFHVTVTLDEIRPGTTRLTMRSIFESAAFRDQVVKDYGAIDGGNQTLARLGVFLGNK